MRYADLPTPRDPILAPERPVLACRGCGDTWSANPGDYWDRRDDEAICAECGDPLELCMVRRVFVPADRLEAWELMVSAFLAGAALTSEDIE